MLDFEIVQRNVEDTDEKNACLPHAMIVVDRLLSLNFDYERLEHEQFPQHPREVVAGLLLKTIGYMEGMEDNVCAVDEEVIDDPEMDEVEVMHVHV